MQIRTRLTLQFILIVAVLLLLSLIFIYVTFSNNLRTEFYKGLESKALMTAEMLVKNNTMDPYIESEQLFSDDEIVLPAREKVIIYNSNFQKVYAFHKADEISRLVLNEIEKALHYKFKVNNYDALGLKYRNKLNEDYFLVCQGMFISDDLKKLRNILIFDFFFIISLVGLGGYIFSRQALSPITEIMNQLDAVFPSHTGKRLEVGNTKDELARLTETFNKLLDRTEEAFANQKGFLSNISHEVKNPMTSVITQLEVSLSKDRSKEEYKKTMLSVLADMAELKEVTLQLMQLARIMADDNKISFELLRLDEIIWQAMTDLKKTHPEYNFKADTTGLPDDHDQLVIYANEQLIKTALSNLLGNACKFSPDHTATIRLYLNDSYKVVMEIEDKGQTISKEDRALIFKPFYRSPATSHIKGTGIGLPLVQSILKLHKATIIINPAQNEGNVFTIYFDQSNNISV